MWPNRYANINLAHLIFNDTFTLTDSSGNNIPIDTSKLYENIYSEFA